MTLISSTKRNYYVTRDLPSECLGLNYIYSMGQALIKKNLDVEPSPLVVVIGGHKDPVVR